MNTGHFEPRPLWPVVALVSAVHLALAWGIFQYGMPSELPLPQALSVHILADMAPEPLSPPPQPKEHPTTPTAHTTYPSVPMATHSPLVSTPDNSAVSVSLPSNHVSPAAPPPQRAEGLTSPTTAPATTSLTVTAAASSTSASHSDPAYLHNPQPVYPLLSRKRGEMGTVHIKAYVEPSGQASRVVLHRSSGYERLDTAALDGVKQWRFVPARENAQPIGRWVLIPIPFGLDE